MLFDRNLFIAYCGIILALIVGGMQLKDTSYNFLSVPLIVFGIIIAILLVFCVLVSFILPVKVFTDSKKSKEFVEKQLSKVCSNGGTIFSTYILEEPHPQDIISESLANASAHIEYQRLFMIDDAEKEMLWVSNFLAKKSKNVSLSLYIIKRVDRLASRIIRSVLPRINIFMVQHNNILQDKVVHLSFPPLSTPDGEFFSNLAVTIYSKKAYDVLFRYCEKILESKGIQEIKSIEQYSEIQKQPLLPILTQQILNSIQDMAETSTDIVHVGIFGSVAKICNKTLVDRFSEEHENDLDLLIIVKDEKSKERIKKDIVSSMRPLNKNIEIDWSKESSEFYYFRKGYRIDIQLHKKHDTYYQVNKLLGYSIFANYHVLYSKEANSINEILDIPIYPSEFNQRKNIYLKDRLGLEDCIRQCANGNINIDPRRIITINVSNFVWAMTGMRPISQRIAKEYVKEYIGQEICEQIEEISGADRDRISISHKEFLSKCISVLGKFRTILESDYSNSKKPNLKRNM